MIENVKKKTVRKGLSKRETSIKEIINGKRKSKELKLATEKWEDKSRISYYTIHKRLNVKRLIKKKRKREKIFKKILSKNNLNKRNKWEFRKIW